MPTLKQSVHFELKSVADRTLAEQEALRTLSAAVYPPDVSAAWPGRAIEWSVPRWGIVAWDERGQAHSHVGALIREGQLDGRLVRIGGVGGLLTLPESRGMGLAAQAMGLAHAHFSVYKVDFALLVCEPELMPFYHRQGWVRHQGDVRVLQRGEVVPFDFNVVMTRAVRMARRPAGDLDLMGPPW